MASSNRSAVVARRELRYSIKGESARYPFEVLIYKPIRLKPGDLNFPLNEGAASCKIEFKGLDECGHVTHGADTLQALELAVNVDPILRRMAEKYDFYFGTGEDYFEE